MTTPDFKIAACACCGKPFPKEEEKSWAKECTACWKAGKGYAPTLSDKAFIYMQQAYEDLVKKNKELEEELEKEKTGKKAAAGKKPGRWSGSGALSKEQVRDLLKLCHPDRHGNNELSTEVTKWLISLR